MIKISKNFYAHEILSPEFFKVGLDPNWYITEFLATFPQQVRDHFGKNVTVNNWKDGGPFKYRGYRPFGCNVGAPMGMHYRGLAVDLNIDGLSQEEILKEIIKNKDKFMVTTYEDLKHTHGWNHFDNRKYIGGSLFCVTP